jgi:hypothetical protein
MSELRLKAQEQETTLKSQIEALEALKKSTTDMHNLIQGLINFSKVLLSTEVRSWLTCAANDLLYVDSIRC